MIKPLLIPAVLSILLGVWLFKGVDPLVIIVTGALLLIACGYWTAWELRRMNEEGDEK